MRCRVILKDGRSLVLDHPASEVKAHMRLRSGPRPWRRSCSREPVDFAAGDVAAFWALP